MRRTIPCSLEIILLLILPVLVRAAEADEIAGDSQATQSEDRPTFEDVLVVTAARTEQTLLEAPVSTSVISQEEITAFPADDYGDLLRNVPGINVSQMGARDIQITGRGATGALATTQLVLVDGRSLYLDFLGFVVWEYLPIDFEEIQQIEVVHAPGSAVWGANAMSGVVNVITKQPKEILGTRLRLGGGQLDTVFGSIAHAGAGEKYDYKVGVSYYEQGQPYERRTGMIPGTESPTRPEGTRYPDYENTGTRQPQVEFRLDLDGSTNSTWRFGGGYAGTEGIIQSGLGPFDIATGSSLSYLQAAWSKDSLRLDAYVNLLDGEAPNLLTVGADGMPLFLGFESETYNIDASDTAVWRDRHILTFGANARKSNFDVTIASQGESRSQYGVFLQDEILIGSRVRWLIGARYDNLDPIDSVVSPRTSLMISLVGKQTIRAAFNRAFRAPSLIESYLDTAIMSVVALPTGPYPIPSRALGNVDLREERLDAIELGYVAEFGKSIISLALYQNNSTDQSDLYAAEFYDGSNPPPGFPLPPFVLDMPPPAGLAGVLPSLFTFRNLGKMVDRGVEFAIKGRPGRSWSWFLNYSWQDKPEVTDVSLREVNIPPEHRLNAGFAFDRPRFFAGVDGNYADEAYWSDVLDARFHGVTDAYTMVNLSAGWRFGPSGWTVRVDAQNVFDEYVQQHVFGDIISRKVTSAMTFRF